MSTENTNITEEQVHQIYNELSDVDKASTDALQNAHEETENSNYNESDNTEIESENNIPGVDLENVDYDSVAKSVEEAEKDIKETLSAYGSNITDEDVSAMLKIIDDYKAGNTTGIYSKLPKSFQDLASGLATAAANRQPTSFKDMAKLRNSAAKTLIEEFIHDAKLSKAIDDYNAEMNKTMVEMGNEYNNLISEALCKSFDKIDEIKTDNPELADNIAKVKEAFAEATLFNKQLEIASHNSNKKIIKWTTRYKYDVEYFNKTVNNNKIGVKVPDISELPEIIHRGCPEYSMDLIYQFISVLIKSINKIDTDSLGGIAYIYKMVSSIYAYKFIEIDEKGKEIFSNISKVIDAIVS